VVNQPFARDDAVVRGFRRIVQSETKIRKHMGRTFWCFANRTEGMVNILIPQATIQGVRGTMAWQEDTERDYGSQKAYGKNTLVVRESQRR
jgi:hypothetical protein